MGDALQPLCQVISDLAKQVHTQHAVAAALQDTPQKGATYEAEVLARLGRWARTLGGTIEHTGPDNKPGDLRVSFDESSVIGLALTIAVEVRDQQNPAGLKKIAEALEQRMVDRQAQAAIYISKSPAGLAKEIEDWTDGICGSGPYVATSDTLLECSARWVVQQCRLAKMRASMAVADVEAIEQHVQYVRVALRKIRQINAKATAARGAVDEMAEIAGELRDEIQDAMAAIEASLRVQPNAAVA